METQLVFFDRNEQLAFMRNDATRLIHYEDEDYIEATLKIDPEKKIESGMYVALYDIDSRYRLFVVQNPVLNPFANEVSFTAESAAMVELSREEPIKDKRPTQVQASAAVTAAIENTEWTLGRLESTAVGSSNFYYQSPWQCLQEVKKDYGCYLSFRVELSDAGIAGRYVDVLANTGRDTGMRLEPKKNLSALTYEVDESDIATALYGRGKGEEVGITESGDTTYGRRITFADVVWSKAKGDPCDKPLGQEWIEDEAATARYGHKGRKIFSTVTFSDCEDPSELLQLTWDELQARKNPQVTLKMTIKDLEAYGYKDESIRMGDTIIAIIDDDLDVQTKIVSIERNYVNPEQTRLVSGTAIKTIIDMQASQSSSLSKYQEMLDLSQEIARRNPDLLNGILDTMKTHILSSGTKMYTDPKDGGMIYESDVETSAVKLTGGGILIADGKIGNEWDWRTAITGKGAVAELIYAGIINANLIKLSGTGTYLDGTTLRIKHPNVSSTSETELGLDGMKMLKDNKIIGGLFKLKEKIVSAVTMLFNPEISRFQAEVGRTTGIFIDGVGIDMLYNGVAGGNVGVYAREDYENAPPAGAYLTSYYGLVLNGDEEITVYSKNGKILLNGKSIDFNSQDDITFRFKHDDGHTYDLSIRDIFRAYLKLFPD